MADRFDVYTRLLGGEHNLPPRLPTPPPSLLPTAKQSTNLDEEDASPKNIVDAFGNLQTYDDFVISNQTASGAKRHPATDPLLRSKPKTREVDSDHDFTQDPRTDEPSELGMSFCTFLALAKFPYKYVDTAFRQPIATAFFDEGKIYDRPWDFYYAWSEQAAKPIAFVPLSQAQTLIDEVNGAFTELKWRFEPYHEEEGLLLTFDDPNPNYRPRFLGAAESRDKYDFFLGNVEPYKFADMHSPEDRSNEAFKEMMALAAEAVKNKPKKQKKARLEKNILSRQIMTNSLLQAQQYLGLRPKETTDSDNGNPSITPVDINEPASHPCDLDVIIIAVDAEAYEKAHNIITEVGVSTLDTRDLKGTAPGAKGQGWQQFIRARHFRVIENKSYVNGEYVAGCPENFDFGKNQWVALNSMSSVLTECFQEPFSKSASAPDSQAPVAENPTQKRNIVLLGHDIEQDIQYCHKLGFSIWGRSNMLATMDTRAMYQAYTRDSSPRGLGGIMNDFDFTAWHLHNAGNDAVYTIWAMLAVCVQDAAERGTDEAKKKHEERAKNKLESAIELAKERARDDNEGWDVGEDGGAPLPQPPSKSGHYTSGGAPLDI